VFYYIKVYELILIVDTSLRSRNVSNIVRCKTWSETLFYMFLRR